MLSVEDLWDLPLTSTTSVPTDDVAKMLDNQIKNTASVSFVNDVSEGGQHSDQVGIRRGAPHHQVRLAEQAAAKAAADARAKKQKIMAIIEQKQDEALSAASIDDLSPCSPRSNQPGREAHRLPTLFNKGESQ